MHIDVQDNTQYYFGYGQNYYFIIPKDNSDSEVYHIDYFLLCDIGEYFGEMMRLVPEDEKESDYYNEIKYLRDEIQNSIEMLLRSLKNKGAAHFKEIERATERSMIESAIHIGDDGPLSETQKMLLDSDDDEYLAMTTFE